ncbi:GM12524 [Drosophila sechellia]|uniref:GM12524 n=1 Tax=Drosophila sechellia TaxID=7238 RepID=B4I060_DROSE|nr:GM12524 [Drosophila sechellia]
MVDKGNEMSENNLDKSEKLQKSQDKKANDKEKSDKKEKKRLRRESEKKSKVEKPFEIVDSNGVASEESSENTDNVENEPPISETNSSPVPELATSTQDSQQAQSVSEELDILAKNRKMSGNGIKTPISGTGNAAPKRRGDDEVQKLENPTKKHWAS